MLHILIALGIAVVAILLIYLYLRYVNYADECSRCGELDEFLSPCVKGLCKKCCSKCARKMGQCEFLKNKFDGQDEFD